MTRTLSDLAHGFVLPSVPPAPAASEPYALSPREGLRGGSAPSERRLDLKADEARGYLDCEGE